MEKAEENRKIVDETFKILSSVYWGLVILHRKLNLQVNNGKTGFAESNMVNLELNMVLL